LQSNKVGNVRLGGYLLKTQGIIYDPFYIPLDY
jgi:hypothetical protein